MYTLHTFAKNNFFLFQESQNIYFHKSLIITLNFFTATILATTCYQRCVCIYFIFFYSIGTKNVCKSILFSPITFITQDGIKSQIIGLSRLLLLHTLLNVTRIRVYYDDEVSFTQKHHNMFGRH